jgi:hypothetical protein
MGINGEAPSLRKSYRLNFIPNKYGLMTDFPVCGPVHPNLSSCYRSGIAVVLME